MMGDPSDAWTYRIAVGALGLALLTVVVGAIVLVALGESNKETSHKTDKTTTVAQVNLLERKTSGAHAITTVSSISPVASDDPPDPAVPTELYIVGGVLVGALLGILLPSPRVLVKSRVTGVAGGVEKGTSYLVLLALIFSIVALALLTILIVAHSQIFKERVVDEVIAASGAAVALGLCVPSPARR